LSEQGLIFTQNKGEGMPAFLVTLAVAVFVSQAPSLPVAPRTPQASSEHLTWLAGVMGQMKTVKAGMTRADLLKVFTTEGGAGSRSSRTFVSRECPFCKVDVTFELVGLPNSELTHCIPISGGRPCDPAAATFMVSDRDKIITISRPYLQLPIID
jgi:hypothetical protein